MSLPLSPLAVPVQIPAPTLVPIRHTVAGSGLGVGRWDFGVPDLLAGWKGKFQILFSSSVFSLSSSTSPNAWTKGCFASVGHLSLDKVFDLIEFHDFSPLRVYFSGVTQTFELVSKMSLSTHHISGLWPDTVGHRLDSAVWQSHRVLTGDLKLARIITLRFTLNLKQILQTDFANDDFQDKENFSHLWWQ